MAGKRRPFDFAALVTSIQEADAQLAAQAIRAVNLGLTLRNWLIGLYIAEFELRGADRAAYGDRLLTELSKALAAHGISNTGRRQLYQYLSFYRAYPEIVRTLPAQFRRLLPGLPQAGKVGSLGMAGRKKPAAAIVRTEGTSRLGGHADRSALRGPARDLPRHGGALATQPEMHARLCRYVAGPGNGARAICTSHPVPQHRLAGGADHYLSAAADLLRHPDDKPTIGLPLCRSKNKIVVEYALRHLKRPIGVAEWETRLVGRLPDDLKGSLPTVEEIEAELMPEVRSPSTPQDPRARSRPRASRASRRSRRR